MLDKAEKEIDKLDRAVKGAIWDFCRKFREDPTTPGLRFKQLKGADLFSARVNDSYRAILARIGDNTWLLLTVAHRSDSYHDLARFGFDVNPVTGGIEFVDIVAVEDSIHDRKNQTTRHDRQTERPLFGAFSSQQLRSLGVTEALLPIIVKLTTEEELLGLVEYAPALTGDILLALHDGVSVEQVRAEIITPQAAEAPVDPNDFEQALARPATVVSTDDQALQMALQGDFDRWKIFLHPTQRALVERDYSGPARVSGGPGTGKTIVALHRVCHLVAQLPTGDTKPVLLTTYTRNLATDLEVKLGELGGDDVLQRVDVVNIDRLARRVTDEVDRSRQPAVIPDAKVLTEWRAMLDGLGDTDWNAEFLAAEWSQVILGQACPTFADYARARRAGRGRALNRAERNRVWRLAERFSKRLDERGWTTHAVTAAVAAQLEQHRAARAAANDQETSSSSRVTYRYQHIAVDEAQDLHPAHWTMLRAMVAPGRNDIFCAGDTHQRIYDNVVTLSSLGIPIRGRSAKLTLNYRTTRQILSSALTLLHGETYDDLDGGLDNLTGYRSVLRGTTPSLRGFDTPDQELTGIVEQLHGWIAEGTSLDTLAVCLPTKDLAIQVLQGLRHAGIPSVELTSDWPQGHDGVRVGTMHRFKGLEFQRMIIAGASEGLVPRSGIDRWRDTDPRRYRREIQRTRSLLFVAATRARDDLAILWHGTPSRFLPTGST